MSDYEIAANDQPDSRPKNMISRISILVFDQVEVLDFAGPFEVFHTARTYWPGPAPTVELVGAKNQALHTVGGMKIWPDRPYSNRLQTDLLVVPGGAGTRPLLQDETLITWIADRSRQSRITLSVCTGALLLAKANVLEGLSATTHHSAYSELRNLAPKTKVRENERFVDNGHIITAAGISAGIDAALHTVARLTSTDVAQLTASHMEYEWTA